MKNIFLFLFIVFVGHLMAQTMPIAEKKVIQFSGIIAEGDSLFGIPGAAIISLSSGTGANSNMMGYFSMPVFEGDSILIAAFGYKKRFLTIPAFTSYSYSLLIELQMDTVLLPEIVLRKFPSEEVFKEVILSMKLTDEVAFSNMEQNLNDQIMARLMVKSDVPPAMSFKYYMDQQAYVMQRKYAVTMNPLTDPFAWARFLKEVQYQKRRKEQEEREKLSNKKY